MFTLKNQSQNEANLIVNNMIIYSIHVFPFLIQQNADIFKT